MAAVAFHIGATHSRVAVYRNKDGRPETIAAECGNRLIKSYINFTGKGHVSVGTAAYKLRKNEPKNTIHGLTHLIGLSYKQIHTRKIADNYAFNIVDGGRDKPAKISILDDVGNPAFYTVVDVLAVLLEYLKTTAENALEMSVTTAVIALPSYLDGKQREAVYRATRHKRVQLKRVQLVSDSSAALLAYKLDRPNKSSRKVAVVQLGGTSSCVTVYAIKQGMIRTLCTTGELAFGGETIDRLLFMHFEGLAAKQMSSIRRDGLSGRAKCKLKEAITVAKCNLSKSQTSVVRCEALADGMDFVASLGRGLFESLLAPALEEGLLEPLKELFDHVKPENQHFQVAIFSGATSLVPKAKEMVTDHLASYAKDSGKAAIWLSSIQSEELVVLGACLQAHLINEAMSTERNHEAVRKAIRGKSRKLPCDLGVRFAGEDIEWVALKGTRYPCTSLLAVDLQPEDKTQNEYILEVVQGPIGEIKEEDSKDDDDSEGNSDSDDDSSEEDDDENVDVVHRMAVKGADPWIRIVPHLDASLTLSAAVWNCRTGKLSFSFRLPPTQTTL